MNGWFNAQQKMTENWFDLFSAATRNSKDAMANNPFAALFPSLVEQWRVYTEQCLRLFTVDNVRLAESAIEQFFAGQEQMLHLLRMVNEAWQTTIVNATSAEEWQKALKIYLEQMRQQMTATLDPAKLTQNSNELWQLYLQEIQKWGQPWFAAVAATPQFVSGAALNSNNATPLLELTNVYWQAFEQTFGRMLGSPSLGLNREFNEKVNKAFALWLENQHATLDYNLLVGNTWLQAFSALMQKLAAMAQSGKMLANQKEVTQLWVEVADGQFSTLFHSDQYTGVQSKVINSGMALRRQLREINEVWLRALDLPTRSDLDEAHRQIYELRKEVKALKKTLNARQTPAPPAAKAPKRRTAKATSKAETITMTEGA